MSISFSSEESGLKVLGITVDVFMDGSHTNNQYSAYRCQVPNQVGPPPHSHPAFDEGFTVLSGQIGIFAEGEWRTLGIGESVFIPRGQVHTFRGESDDPAVFMGIATPAGHDQFFRDMNAVAEPTMEAIFKVLSKNGILPATQ